MLAIGIVPEIRPHVRLRRPTEKYLLARLSTFYHKIHDELRGGQTSDPSPQVLNKIVAKVCGTTPAGKGLNKQLVAACNRSVGTKFVDPRYTELLDEAILTPSLIYLTALHVTLVDQIVKEAAKYHNTHRDTSTVSTLLDLTDLTHALRENPALDALLS